MISARPPALPLPPVPLTLAVAVAMLWWMMPLVAKDMQVFLIPWFDHIAALGPVAAFAEPFSDYAPSYLYLLAALTPLKGVASTMTLIKLLSLAGTAVLAFAARHLLIRLGAPQPDRAAALVFLLPSVLLNAGLLGQCDAMWVAPCVMAVAAAIDRKHAAMLAWCGLALGFKAQSVLIAPFFLALLIQRRVPFRLWPIAPAVFAATMLPAWAAGWPAGDLATIYLRQAGTYPALSFNAPNIWVILQALPLGAPLAGLAAAAAIGATAAYIARFSAQILDSRALLHAALLAPLVTAGLLPRMHERYFFLADILALVLALAYRDKRSWTIAILVQVGSTLALLGYISGLAGFAMLGGVAMIVATLRVARPLLQRAANDNPLLARAI
jgi:Gpi18-like mannosyltransferase